MRRTRTTRSTRTAALVSILAAALAGVMGGTLLGIPAGWAATGTASTTQGATGSAENPVALAYAAWHNAVAAAVQGRPDRYTGVYREPGGRFVVTLPAGTDTRAARVAVLTAARVAVAPFGAAAAAAAQAAEPVTFRHVAHTRHELQRVLDDVATARHAGVAAVASVRSWWVDPRRGRVVVGLQGVPTSAEKARLRALLGADVDVTAAALGAPSSRSADSAPWYGGDRITSTAGVTCSSGFSVKAGSSSYELTAGHCGSSTWKVGSTTIGVTPLRNYYDGGLDTEGVAASSVSGRVYTGCVTCSTSLPVKGRWDPVVGDQLCFDGSVTGLVCAASVTSTNRCIDMTSGVTTCHLALVSKSDGTTVVAPGDSGGPVFWKTSTSVYAAGTIVGFYGSGNVGLVEPLASILPALGLSLVTG